MRRKTTKIISVLFILLGVFNHSLSAQEVAVDKLKLKDNGFKEKKFNKAEKRIFLQHFFVNYQMMYGETEVARGGREMGGGYRGDAEASLVLGIQGVELEQLQKMTDALYQKYVSRLEQAGYTLVGPEAVMENEYFEGWEKLEGGTPLVGQFPGYVTTVPKGFNYLAASVSDDGKIKSKSSIFDLAGMSVSKKLDGLIVARVNITVPFAKGAESQGSRALTKTFGGVAKVVIKPNLNISPMETIMQEGNFKKPLQSITEMSFAFKRSLKYQALYKVSLKKPLEIEGVFEEKKYKSISSASQDLWGSKVGALSVFSVDNNAMDMVQPVPCDGAVYEKGVAMGINAFMDKALEGFLDHIK